MSTIKPELIHLHALKVYKTHVDASNDYIDNPSEIKNISVQYAQKSSFNFKKKAIRIRLETLMQAVNDDDEEIGLNAEYGIEFHFIIENLDEYIEEDEKTKTINGTLGGTLMGIVYSTARGIVFDRTQGTHFKGVILPVIDPKELISNKSQKNNF